MDRKLTFGELVKLGYIPDNFQDLTFPQILESFITNWVADKHDRSNKRSRDLEDEKEELKQQFFTGNCEPWLQNFINDYLMPAYGMKPHVSLLSGGVK